MKPYSHGPPKARVCRQSEYARKIRDDLRAKLGGVCAACGTEKNLSFDLKTPNGVKHHGELSWCHRMIYYRRQFEAGNLQLLCTFHNSQKRDRTEPAPALASDAPAPAPRRLCPAPARKARQRPRGPCFRPIPFDLMPLKIPMPPKLATPREAYIAGMKAGADEPNTRNAHYRYFSSPLLRSAWETGLAHGRKYLVNDSRLL